MKIKLFRCNHCGNIVVKLAGGKVAPTCCGEKMTELKPNVVEASVEKHLPVITKEGNEVKVSVGSVLHPMTEEHNIQFAVLVTNKGYKINFFKVDDTPETTFALVKGERVKEAYAFCTLHGLWLAKL